jgi:RNA polymerase sigma-70 factor (ECF subfamily)
VTQDEQVERFLALLAPLHDAARVAARRICQSRADGDDLFQDATLRALDQLTSLRDETRFRPWFYAIMLSVQRERHRRRFWRRLFSFDLVAERPAPAADVEEWEGAERMAHALATLGPKAREAIVLFEIEGFTLDELAALQNDSIPAVKSRLSRARQQLRRYYEKLDGVRAGSCKERRHGNG